MSPIELVLYAATFCCYFASVECPECVTFQYSPSFEIIYRVAAFFVQLPDGCTRMRVSSVSSELAAHTAE